MSEDERLQREMRGLEEQKLKEALAEKVPEWQLYCYMGSTNLG
jgi:hypothetical protein